MKPILFSTPMVGAILDGRKTMTRRVVKVEKPDEWQDFNDCRNECGSANVPCYIARLKATEAIGVMYPKYDVGDILWVRETWMQAERGYIYKNAEPYLVGKPTWRPSIFMPKDACRIWLRVTDVRVERVQDITNNDAIKEGCAGAECDCLRIGRSWMGCESCMNTGWQEPPVVEFMQLWEHLNAKRGYGWDANPWVWVISFERCDKPKQEG